MDTPATAHTATPATIHVLFLRNRGRLGGPDCPSGADPTAPPPPPTPPEYENPGTDASGAAFAPSGSVASGPLPSYPFTAISSL